MLITPAIIFTLSAAAPAHHSLKESPSSGHVDTVSHNGTLFSWGSFSQLTQAGNDPTVLPRDLKSPTLTLWIFGSKETRDVMAQRGVSMSLEQQHGLSGSCAHFPSLLRAQLPQEEQQRREG